MKVQNGLDLGSQKIINLANPTNPQDASSKQYVDNVAAGLDWHTHVRVNAASPITVASPGTTVDGVTMAAGDRVLLTAQGTASQNGLWVWNASGSALTRPTDYAAAAVLTKTSVTVFVTEGTSADKAFSLSTDGTVTVDTTSTTWVQVGGGTTYTAGNGLTGATTFSVLAQDTSIDVSASGIRVGSGALLTNGGLQGGSGTGISVKNTTGITVGASGVGVDFSVVTKKYTTLLGAITGGTPLTVNHALGNQYVTCQLYIAGTGEQVLADVILVDASNLTVTVATSQSANFYRVVVVG